MKEYRLLKFYKAFMRFIKKFANLILLIIIFFLLTKLFYNNKIINKTNNRANERIRALEYTIKDLKQYNLFSIEVENQILNECLIRNQENEILKLDNVIKNETIVFRIFENSCRPCIEENLLNISNLAKNKNVIILGSFYNFASYNFFAKQNKLLKCYMTNKILFKNQLERFEIMYYFIINEEMEVSKIHVPLNNDSNYTTEYLSIINKIP